MPKLFTSIVPPSLETVSEAFQFAPAVRIGGQNLTKWCNKDYDEMLVKARSLSDQGDRAKLYEKMQEIEHEEAPELLVAHSTVFEAMRANVTGYKQSPLGTHEFEGVDLQ